MVTVYVDGVQCKTAPLRFPSLNEVRFILDFFRNILMNLFCFIDLSIHISAFHFLLHWISWSPDHYHHYDYLSNSTQPIPLALRDGICSSYWAAHPFTFTVLPSILCGSRRRAARRESRESCPHHPSRAAGHSVGVSILTGGPFSDGVHLS